MGAKINDAQGGFIFCEADKLRGCEIQLDYPSVGATENIMLASAFAEGDTLIRNAAKEPEIADLQDFMNGMGIEAAGAGTGTVLIRGNGKKLHSVDHSIITDRIVAGTYMIAAGITGGELNLTNVIPGHLGSIISILRECGCEINIGEKELYIKGPERAKAIDIIRTLPYPGFPTDMQAQLVALLSVAHGTSVMIETVFENRYKHVEELLRMGASISLEGRTAIIRGVGKLTGARVKAGDLRGGAALVLAGLAAEGETIVSNIKHIDRGYEEIEIKLRKAGADIRRV
jgi:UDP-N-acetylglucosamine 1-carboxyvinyltransferase